MLQISPDFSRLLQIAPGSLQFPVLFTFFHNFFLAKFSLNIVKQVKNRRSRQRGQANSEKKPTKKKVVAAAPTKIGSHDNRGKPAVKKKSDEVRQLDFFFLILLKQLFFFFFFLKNFRCFDGNFSVDAILPLAVFATFAKPAWRKPKVSD